MSLHIYQHHFLKTALALVRSRGVLPVYRMKFERDPKLVVLAQFNTNFGSRSKLHLYGS